MYSRRSEYLFACVHVCMYLQVCVCGGGVYAQIHTPIQDTACTVCIPIHYARILLLYMSQKLCSCPLHVHTYTNVLL